MTAIARASGKSYRRDVEANSPHKFTEIASRAVDMSRCLACGCLRYSRHPGARYQYQVLGGEPTRFEPRCSK